MIDPLFVAFVAAWRQFPNGLVIGREWGKLDFVLHSIAFATAGDLHDALLDEVRALTPAQHLVTIEEIGRIATVLVSDAGMTLNGSTIYAGAGFQVMA